MNFVRTHIFRIFHATRKIFVFCIWATLAIWNLSRAHPYSCSFGWYVQFCHNFKANFLLRFSNLVHFHFFFKFFLFYENNFKNKTICRYLGSGDGNTTNSCSHVQSVQPLKEFQKNDLFWVYFRILNFFEIEKTSKKPRKNKKKPEN